MKRREQEDLSNLSMLELFQAEAEGQTAILSGGLLELERDPTGAQQLEALMRAAHSLKGAALIVGQETAVRVAHAMEDCFVAAQQGRVQFKQVEIDLLLQGVDILTQISRRSGEEGADKEAGASSRVQNFLSAMAQYSRGGKPPETPTEPPHTSSPPLLPPPLPAKRTEKETTRFFSKPEAGGDKSRKKEGADRMLRVTAENLNRLLGLAGESLVESRWLKPYAESLTRLKRLQGDLLQGLHGLQDALQEKGIGEHGGGRLTDALGKVVECRQFLTDRLAELEMYDRRASSLSHRLYLEVLQCRMRPFGDAARRFPRMVRDLARALGKQVKLEIVGEATQVDRDILEKLETPLTHLLRNAVDHGCEPPDERKRLGKGEECTIRLEARHSAGMLMIVVSDDGRGIHPEHLRDTISSRKLITQGAVEKMSEGELLEFLLLPGFTMKETVTEHSGRGVGLDVVQTMVKGVRGNIRIGTQPGKGMRFQLQLPLTLSVLRTLLVEVGSEPYAIPLSQIHHTIKLPRDRIEVLEGRHHFALNGTQIGLLTAHQVLECGEPRMDEDELPVVVMGDRSTRYGLVVDRFLGERELVVQTLDPRLGKVRDISAGALMEDGAPVLIVDVEDMIVSIEKLVSSGGLNRVQSDDEAWSRRSKRILVVDDSLTVRELQKKLLMARGYTADVAVDGMDGWNAVQARKYDLVITDVDMPRLDGIELVAMMKRDSRFASLPILIVSYKDREEDRLRGLEAGADYYLTKGSFHDETLMRAVADLIGEAYE